MKIPRVTEEQMLRIVEEERGLSCRVGPPLAGILSLPTKRGSGTGGRRAPKPKTRIGKLKAFSAGNV